MRSRRSRHGLFVRLHDPVICAACRKDKSAGPCDCPPPPATDFEKLTLIKMNRRQKILHYTGKVLAAILAIASGVTTAAAFFSLNMVSAGAPMIILTVLVFLAGFAANWYIFKRSTPRMLVEAFGEGWPFQTLMKGMSTRRKIAMGFAILLSLCVGLTTGALTSSSVLKLTMALGITAAFPPLGILLFVVTFICLSSTMLYNFRPLIKNPNPRKDIQEFLNKLFSTDIIYKHNCINGDPAHPKSPWRRQLERVFKVLFALAILSLAGFGLFMTMSASSLGLKTSLLRVIPEASIQAVEIVGKIICLGGALLGRIPFTVRNIFKTFSKMFVSAGTDLSLKLQGSEITTEWKQEAEGEAKPIMLIKQTEILIYGRQRDGQWKVTAIPKSELSLDERNYLDSLKKETTLKNAEFFQKSFLKTLEKAHAADEQLLPPSKTNQGLYYAKVGGNNTLAVINGAGNGFVAGSTNGDTWAIVGGAIVSVTAALAGMNFSRPPPKSPPSPPSDLSEAPTPAPAVPNRRWSAFSGRGYTLNGLYGGSKVVSRDDANLEQRLLDAGSSASKPGWFRRKSSILGMGANGA